MIFFLLIQFVHSQTPDIALYKVSEQNSQQAVSGKIKNFPGFKCIFSHLEHVEHESKFSHVIVSEFGKLFHILLFENKLLSVTGKIFTENRSLNIINHSKIITNRNIYIYIMMLDVICFFTYLSYSYVKVRHSCNHYMALGQRTLRITELNNNRRNILSYLKS